MSSHRQQLAEDLSAGQNAPFTYTVSEMQYACPTLSVDDSSTDGFVRNIVVWGARVFLGFGIDSSWRGKYIYGSYELVFVDGMVVLCKGVGCQSRKNSSGRDVSNSLPMFTLSFLGFLRHTTI